MELREDKEELKQLMYRIMEERNLPYPDAVKYGVIGSMGSWDAKTGEYYGDAL